MNWAYSILEDSDSKVCVELKTRTVLSPFEIKRRISLDKASPEILFEESIENLSSFDMKYMWGHHPAFGAPFLSGDCRIELPACRLFEGDETLLDIPPEGQSRKAMFYALDLKRGIYTSLPHQLYGQIDPLPVISGGQKIQTKLLAFFYRGDLPHEVH